jgi:hypothetical protein
MMTHLELRMLVAAGVPHSTIATVVLAGELAAAVNRAHRKMIQAEDDVGSDYDAKALELAEKVLRTF